ncbi:MAG TPA: TerC family protein [Rubricoccaceae bacterium]
MLPTDQLDVPMWAWVGLNVFVVALLLLDLLVFNRKNHTIGFREAARLSAFFVGAALSVNAFVWAYFGAGAAGLFLMGYIVEVSLSVDNLFVIAVLFSYFGVPPLYQHRVLFWGIFGAIVMRATMIFLGVALIERFDWLLYVFGAFLLVTGLRMFRHDSDANDVSDNKLLTFLRRALPVTQDYHGERFFVREGARRMVTPLFLVLVMIELTDLVFAVDSIPAILAVTTDPFLAFGSNIMAVVGLRALYFLLAGIIERVRYLHIGLGLVLVFIGIKLLISGYYHVPTELSLVVIVVCLSGAAIASWIAARREGPGADLTAGEPPPGLPFDADDRPDALHGEEASEASTADRA